MSPESLVSIEIMSVGERIMRTRNIMTVTCLTLLAGAIHLNAGASGGGGQVFVGTVTPGPGAPFIQFQYVEVGAAPISLIELQAGVLPQYAIEFNALLSGPTDGVNLLDSVGFSNGTSQPLAAAGPGAGPETPLLQAASASGLLGGLDTNTASVTALTLTVSFVQLGTFKFVTVYTANFTVGLPTVPVGIMIKPAAPPPVPINPVAMGTLPVAILSTPTFDATTQVNLSSVTFGHAGTEPSLAMCDPGGQDVNGDGLPDLVCHFYTQKTGFVSGDTMGFLQGATVPGVGIQGSEAITIVPH